MFRKILIANRGEIACRIIKTARRMGISSVAVYSEADAGARHVRLADEAIAIGPAPVQVSYLNAGRILQAAHDTGAEAVHPGYGFLSENADFAEACAANKLIFVGPPPAAIRAMGLKSAAKALMGKAAVPLTPGYHGHEQGPELLAREAAKIGYPVLIKASAGGGGKGMRRVDRPEDFAAALSACQREAASAFGNDAVLIEEYVTRPRHIEVQVFADTFGHCLSLFERDCSVQRRHQKVLEEAPAPGMTSERRAAMGKAAVAAAKAVGYVGAGTVEFIVRPDGAFYFMEMNTRLQVEHPVTEMVTGLDLVAWQLRVANGEKLPLSQEEVRLEGHAIEARIYAEDPDRGFLPSVGHLDRLSTPALSEHVRIDSGVDEGDEITPHYDPMIAKLIAWDRDREGARTRLAAALAQFHVVGVKTNVEFLIRLAACSAFVNADLDTGLIERNAASLFVTEATPSPEIWPIVTLAHLLDERARDGGYRADDWGSPWRARDGFRLNGGTGRTVSFRLGDATVPVRAVASRGGWDLAVAGRLSRARGQMAQDGLVTGELDGRRFSARVLIAGNRHTVFLAGRKYELEALDGLDGGGAASTAEGGLRSRMPGRIVALLVTEGTKVAKGAPLLVMEAMKMEHTLAAPADGTVKAFRCARGDQVAEGVELVDFTADP